jgi:nitroreductase
MTKPAITSTAISSLLANRWSTRSYDAKHVITDEQALAIIEAGRWSPSANNLQPWRFSLLKRGTDLHTKISTEALSGFNAMWAPDASAYLVISRKLFTADGAPNFISTFDCGLAAMSIMIEAEAHGLNGHVMAGITHDKVAEILGLSEDLGVLVVIAIGKPHELTEAEAEATGRNAIFERQQAPRQRHALNEIVLHGLN